MKSPAEAHRNRVLAEKQADATSQDDYESATIYELMLLQLSEHKRELKGIQSDKTRAEVKSGFLSEYDEYLDGVMAGESSHADEVFATLAIWHLDVGNYERALELVGYAIKHGMPSPERFERSMQAVVAEQFAEAALAEDSAVTYEQLSAVEALVREADLHDQIKAKLERGLGEKTEDPKIKLSHFKKAMDLNAKIGLKGKITALEKEMAAANEPPPTTKQDTGDVA